MVVKFRTLADAKYGARDMRELVFFTRIGFLSGEDLASVVPEGTIICCCKV